MVITSCLGQAGVGYVKKIRSIRASDFEVCAGGLKLVEVLGAGFHGVDD